ncbi:WD40 containing domain protein [Mycena sanguinolenta]|uniref:WD40 containing domain protein n=1 Tax=Mycena sanguinolenta TaxID=230812 RepID=A0A8H6ZF23_9AGAR|nr:WD40 containing domain protein [Mycena sanguinolenta]
MASESPKIDNSSHGGAGGQGGGANLTLNHNFYPNTGPSATQLSAPGTPDSTPLLSHHNAHSNAGPPASAQLSAPVTQGNLAAHPENKTYCDELLRQGRGFPLFVPEPQLNLPAEWQKKGVAIGDVGQVTPDGSFDFLFNIYLGANDPINAYGVPEGFKPLPREDAFEIKAVDFEGGNFVGSHTVTLTGVDGKQEFPGGRFNFSCRQSTGAVLALPHGAHQEQLLNLRRMELYAAEHAESWYKYANITRGRGLVNGRLYLITGWEKAKSWGIAGFRDVSLQSEFKLSFGPTADSANGYKYRWSGSQYRYKQADSPLDDGTPLNHTTFIHAFTISLGERVWEKLFRNRLGICQPLNWPTFQKNSGRRLVPYRSHGPSSPWSIFARIFSVRMAQDNGGRSSVPPRAPFPHFAGGSASSRGRQATASAPGDGIVTDAFPILQITHPSEIIHQRILREVPRARVVITHDDAWRDVFKEDGMRTSGQTASELQQAIFDRFEIVEVDGAASLRAKANPATSRDATTMRGEKLSSIQHAHQLAPNTGLPRPPPTVASPQLSPPGTEATRTPDDGAGGNGGGDSVLGPSFRGMQFVGQDSPLDNAHELAANSGPLSSSQAVAAGSQLSASGMETTRTSDVSRQNTVSPQAAIYSESGNYCSQPLLSQRATVMPTQIFIYEALISCLKDACDAGIPGSLILSAQFDFCLTVIQSESEAGAAAHDVGWIPTFDGVG